MKKFLGKKAILIAGSVLIVSGLVAIPAFAATSEEGAPNVFGKMQSFMSQTFNPGQHQEIMNSGVMQELHNSDAMQEAMQTGDIAKMQEAMNSNPEVKELLGEETLNEMNQFMEENAQEIGQMMQGQNLEVMNEMMNSQNVETMNQMMSQFGRDDKVSQGGSSVRPGMMGSVSQR